MNNETREWIFKLLDKETKGLNMKIKNAKDKLIFSYNDVVQILNKFNDTDQNKNEVNTLIEDTKTVEMATSGSVSKSRLGYTNKTSCGDILPEKNVTEKKQ